jgi:hypothetical protein
MDLKTLISVDESKCLPVGEAVGIITVVVEGIVVAKECYLFVESLGKFKEFVSPCKFVYFSRGRLDTLARGWVCKSHNIHNNRIDSYWLGNPGV